MIRYGARDEGEQDWFEIGIWCGALRLAIVVVIGVIVYWSVKKI